MNTIVSVFLAFCFVIPSISTTSPLKECNGTLAQRQAIVDAEDLALYQRYGNGHLICDHSMSDVGGLWCMEDVGVGDVGILYTEDGARFYECTAIVKAKRGKTTYNFRGKPFLPDKGDIVAVSCVDETGDWVYAAYFDYKFSE